MEQQDVERILRDVVSTRGLPVTLVRVERLAEDWLATITDETDRIVNRRIHDGPPAAVRAALLQWLDPPS